MIEEMAGLLIVCHCRLFLCRSIQCDVSHAVLHLPLAASRGRSSSCCLVVLLLVFLLTYYNSLFDVLCVNSLRFQKFSGRLPDNLCAGLKTFNSVIMFLAGKYCEVGVTFAFFGFSFMLLVVLTADSACLFACSSW